MRYDKKFEERDGPLMVVTKKDDTGSIVIVSISQTRKKNILHNEENKQNKRRD